jgi:hypothetical protein
MLWECGECGEPTATRRRVCPNCGIVTRYTPSESADTGREIGSLREYWLSAGLEKKWPPPRLST